MPTKVKVTEELLYDLYKAALDNVRDFLMYESEYTIRFQGRDGLDGHERNLVITVPRPEYRNRDYAFHDDSHDYLDAALEIASLMRSAYYDGATEYLERWLNLPTTRDQDELMDHDDNTYFPTPLDNFACDGIPPAFYELDCPALPKER
jgi:hypothetical protein